VNAALVQFFLAIVDFQLVPYLSKGDDSLLMDSRCKMGSRDLGDFAKARLHLFMHVLCARPLNLAEQFLTLKTKRIRKENEKNIYRTLLMLVTGASVIYSKVS
jgi:hypothetical protein